MTGANGQLGREIVLHCEQAGIPVTGIGREQIDFASPADVASGIAKIGADWVINCAAYTQVDKAEDEPDIAYAINRDSARAVATGVKQSGGCLLHVSTDFIFDGEQSTPYREEDKPNPLGIYGLSKWQGEQAVRQELPDAIIMRTAWVYGIHGDNFVKTILRLAAEREELGVIDEQIGTPSWTGDIVHAIMALIAGKHTGTYHYTNEGVASWYDFAVQTVEFARELGFPVKLRQLLPIPASQYPLPASRPANSVLSKQKIRAVLSRSNPHWRTSLHTMLGLLRDSGK